MAGGQRTEMLQIGLEPPRQAPRAADDAVLGDGGDEDESDGHQSDPLTAFRETRFDIQLQSDGRTANTQ
jgi:hypothetical protein